MENKTYIDNIKFQYLNPIDNSDSNEVKDLVKILSEKKIKNIAVTGPYSSGKSSIVNTALKEINKKKIFNKKTKSITISLAKLMNDNETKEINNNKNENNNDIKNDSIDTIKTNLSSSTEKSSNQVKDDKNENNNDTINYNIDTIKTNLSSSTEKSSNQVKDDKNENNNDTINYNIDTIKTNLTKSIEKHGNHVKVDKNELRRTIVEKIYYSCVKNEIIHNIGIVLFVVWITAILFMGIWLYKYNMFDYWKDYYEKYLIVIKTNLIILICISLAVILYMIIRKTKHASLSYGDINLDLSFDTLENPFITNLQPIIKMLKRKKIKYIIFEDLDRFNCYSIFDDLRDFNDNLNKLMEITFVYEVRDDIFTPESKGKFFDIAIPVVPFVSFESSGDELKKFFNNSTLSLLDKYINNVSVYINDIRILKNAYNSYCIYYTNLDKSIESKESLFTYMLYKELFPEDFCKFINHEGVIIGIIEKFKKEIDKTLKDKFDEIKNKENLKNEYEINKDYENIPAIEKEIQTLEDEVGKLNSKSIKFFIDKYTLDTQEFMSGLKQLNNENARYIEFIKFAIRNGYIDTDYSNYIHRFNKGSRTREDNDFVVKIRSLNNVDNFDYKINNVASVVNVLVDTDYAKSDSINLNILRKLELLNKNELEIYLNTLIHSPYYKRALEEYHTNEEGYPLFIGQLVQWDNNIFNTILNTKEKDNIIKFIINNVNIAFISHNNSVNELISYLEYNNTINLLESKRYEILKELKVKINNLENISDSKLEKYIVENELYKINYINIFHILRNNKIKVDLINRKNMTEIMNNKKLKKYVLSNFDTYLNDCYSQLNNQSDTQDILCEIINDSTINEENIRKFMEKQNDIIDNIELIKDEMVEFCLKNSYLEYSLKNIIKCLNNGIDESIVYSCINENKITIKRGDNKYVDTIKKMLNNNLLNIDSANDLLKVKFKKCDKYQYDEIISISNKEIVKAIVKSNNISFDKDILNYIISKDYNMDNYIVNNKEKIVRDFEEIKQYLNLKAKTIIINSKNKNEFSYGDEIRCKVLSLFTETEIEALDINTLENIFNLQVDNKFTINFKMFNRLFYILNDENRVKLINNNITDLAREKLIDIISSMDDENYQKILINGRIAKINNTDDNLLLIKNLKSKNFNIEISKSNEEILILKRNNNKV